MASVGLIGLALGSILKIALSKHRETFKINDSDFNATKESLSYSFNLRMDFNHFSRFNILDMKFTGLYKFYENNMQALSSTLRQLYALCDRNICEIDFRGNTLMLSLSYTIAGRKLMHAFESGYLNQEIMIETLERYFEYAEKEEAIIARCITLKE